MTAHDEWWSLHSRDFDALADDMAQSLHTIHREYAEHGITPFVVIRPGNTKLVLVRTHGSGYGGFCASTSLTTFADKLRRVHPIPASTIPSFNRNGVSRQFWYDMSTPSQFPVALRHYRTWVRRHAQRES